MEETTYLVAPTLTWDEAFAGWLGRDGARAGGKGKLGRLSVLGYLQDVHHFARWFEARQGCGFALDLLSRAVVREYFDWQAGEKAAPKTQNRRLASLRMLVRFGRDMGLIDYDPTDRQARAQEADAAPRAKSPDEYERLVDGIGAHLRRQTLKHGALGLRDAVIFGLMARAGLRIAEVAGLDAADVDMAGKRLRVMGKGGKVGHVRIPAALVEDIRAWMATRPQHAEALICGWDGGRLTTGQIRRRIKLIGQAAGVELNPHDLRHTYIYRLLDAFLKGDMALPVALDAVRQQARHSDTRTTMGYLRASAWQVQAAVEVM